MKTLTLELSTVRASMAWFADVNGADSTHQFGRPATQLWEWPNDRKDSGMFFENLERAMQEFGQPEKIIVGLGPGSYAGVRIAISAAIGLAAASQAELIGYPSVSAIAGTNDDYAVIGDARRQSFFFVRIRRRTVVGDYELHTAAELSRRIEGLRRDVPVFSFDALPQFQPRVEQRYPSAEVLGQFAAGTGFVRMPLEPIYLREAHVTIPKPVKKGAG
jgi:tRNA threonylcarbamoyladenosine biosynthesis protein TsaB